MAQASFVVLHVGHGPELTLLEYLGRVLLHLLAFGGVAALVFWWSDVVDAVRSAVVADRGGDPNER